MGHSRIRRALPTAGIILSASLSFACSKEKPAETPEPAPAATPADDNNAPGKDPAQAQIRISPGIAEACGITDSNTFFAYNSAKVSSVSAGVFKQLADCFTTGPLAGKTMRIVGFTDPRGDEEYNMVLGGRRADNVALALTNAQLPKAQLQTSSRGEIEARGSDEASWATDRKVELFLADE